MNLCSICNRRTTNALDDDDDDADDDADDDSGHNWDEDATIDIWCLTDAMKIYTTQGSRFVNIMQIWEAGHVYFQLCDDENHMFY